MKQLLSAFVILLASITCKAQNYTTSLYGFQLEQYREVTFAEFGKPFEENEHEDGVKYDVYILNKDRSLYMVFEYLPSQPESIFSIQISGTEASADLRFKDLHLGDSAEKVEAALGKPSEKADIGEYGTQWTYEGANYSLEINPEGKLSSIKIRDTFYKDGKESENIPDFKNDILPKLTSGKNEVIATLLAPDVEVSNGTGEMVLYFAGAFDTEIKQDKGNVYGTIKLMAQGLEKVDTSKTPYQYDENIRLIEGQDPLYVIKINNPNTFTSEIVFKYVNNKWLIWEIKSQSR